MGQYLLVPGPFSGPLRAPLVRPITTDRPLHRVRDREQRRAEPGRRQWPVTETGDSSDYWQSTAFPLCPRSSQTRKAMLTGIPSQNSELQHESAPSTSVPRGVVLRASRTPPRRSACRDPRATTLCVAGSSLAAYCRSAAQPASSPPRSSAYSKAVSPRTTEPPVQAPLHHDQLHDDAPPQQADGGPHMSRAITGGSPTPRTHSRHKALTWTYALTLDQLDACGRFLRHVPCGAQLLQGVRWCLAHPSDPLMSHGSPCHRGS